MVANPTQRALSRGIAGAFVRWTAVVGGVDPKPHFQQRIAEAFDSRSNLDSIDRLEVLSAASLRLRSSQPEIAEQAEAEALQASADLPPATVSFVEELLGVHR